MFTFLQTAKIKRIHTGKLSPTISSSTLKLAITDIFETATDLAGSSPNPVSVFVTFPVESTASDGCKRTVHVTASDLLRSKLEWAEKEFREAYAEAAVEQGIAWQLRTNRERRGLSQKKLAQLTHTKQSSVSRMEDPEYGRQSLGNLMKIAAAFDCALLVKFVAFSTLAHESQCLAPDNLYAPSFTEEVGNNGRD